MGPKATKSAASITANRAIITSRIRTNLPRGAGRPSRTPPRPPRLRPGPDPGDEPADGQRPVALDDPDPERVLLGTPVRGGFGSAEDALDLADPVRQHLLAVGEHLARAPVRLGLGSESLRERPWLAGF